jgi:hypothetical protein
VANASADRLFAILRLYERRKVLRYKQTSEGD